jgi:hypothetical protein
MSEPAVPMSAAVPSDASQFCGPRLLTGHLLCPVGPDATERAAAISDAVEKFPAALADIAVSRAGGRSFRLTDHDVRTALDVRDRNTPDRPFIWSARTTRRGLGLAALRLVVSGTARTPADGARLAVAEAVDAARAGERSVSPMNRWLARLPNAGLAAVQAEAVTWATRLWCALDWSAFDQPPVIGRDRWWNSPHSSLLAIRSRAEVRAVVADGAGNPFSVHLVVLGGRRRPSIRDELSVVAVTEALLTSGSGSLPPGRIVGWWPDSGHMVRVEVNRIALATGLAAVARTWASAETEPVESTGFTRVAA